LVTGVFYRLENAQQLERASLVEQAVIATAAEVAVVATAVAVMMMEDGKVLSKRPRRKRRKRVGKVAPENKLNCTD